MLGAPHAESGKAHKGWSLIRNKYDELKKQNPPRGVRGCVTAGRSARWAGAAGRPPAGAERGAEQ